MNVLLLLLATYVLTGIALTAYDFAAPPLHAKVYVIQRNHAAALRNWFLWPIGVAFELYEDSRMRRPLGRRVLGIGALLLGTLLVLRFLYLIVMLIFSLAPLAYGIAMLGGIFLSPIVAAATMPRHGQPPRPPAA
jgi:hypothetical protein